MAIVNIPYIFTVGAVIVAAQHNSNFSTIYNDYSGNIQDVNIASNAGIEYSKLALSGTIKQSDLSSTFNSSSGIGVIPSGGIIMWSGSIASIPTGWFLCNGSNSTPDLRNRFIVCADADVATVAESTISGSAAQSGGSVTITQGNLPSANGTFTRYDGNGAGLTGVQGTTNGTNAQTQSVALGGSGTAYVQPYFALAYIMKS